jgi:GntR family transcriptional regulator/MocR family aminotransferase
VDGPLLVIDRDAAQPIGVQLVEGLRRGILAGDLRPDDPVPSTRALATELGVSRSAVVAAYEQLAGEGYLEMRQGAPTRVAELVRPDADGDRRPDGARAGCPERAVAERRPAPHRPAAGAAVDDADRRACVAGGLAARGGARDPVGVAAAVRRGGAPRRDRRPPAPGTRRGVRGRRHRGHRRHQRALSLLAAALAQLVDGADP